MASSIDRYRPPREGYQPPAIPQPPPGSAPQDRRSSSPARPRDIPPPAPSPPTHTSRTSPPRPRSRREPQSPRYEPAGSPVAADEPSDAVNQWLFTLDEAKSSPSILDGLSPTEERLRRAKGVNFIYQVGVMLDLPQITLWVAGVFFHRFYMRCSLVEEKGGVHHYNIAATAIFLANKTEENCRKTKDIIIAVAKVAQKNPKLYIDEQSKEYWRWRDSILAYEELMLELLTFDLVPGEPYRCLFTLLEQINEVHNKTLRHAAWAFLNDSCLTHLPLLMEARDVAIGSIFFACVHTSHPITDIDGKAWWQYLKGSEEHCLQAVEMMMQFWEENPLKKQNPTISSPAFQLDSTRRRGEAGLMQADTPSSAAPTPLDLDRATQSPRGHANGGTAEREAAGPAAPTTSSGVAAPGTPTKRKGDDLDQHPEARSPKRRRESESDEGEVAES